MYSYPGLMLCFQDLELFSNIIHELGSEGEKKKNYRVFSLGNKSRNICSALHLAATNRDPTPTPAPMVASISKGLFAT